ncbi:hypothetical protein Peur_059356 [Populus x canadensis]
MAFNIWTISNFNLAVQPVLVLIFEISKSNQLHPMFLSMSFSFIFFLFSFISFHRRTRSRNKSNLFKFGLNCSWLHMFFL